MLGIEHGEFATRFTLRCPLGERPIVLRAGGAHNVANALAAAAAAAAAGASLDDVVPGLADFRPVAGRLQLKGGPARQLDHRRLVQRQPELGARGTRGAAHAAGHHWLVLGDMAELGEHASDSHAHLGGYARECGVKRLFAVGPQSSRAVETFGAGGEWFADAESLIRRLQTELAPAVTVLVKGSRINRLERVVQALTGASAGAD